MVDFELFRKVLDEVLHVADRSKGDVDIDVSEEAFDRIRRHVGVDTGAGDVDVSGDDLPSETSSSAVSPSPTGRAPPGDG